MKKLTFINLNLVVLFSVLISCSSKDTNDSRTPASEVAVKIIGDKAFQLLALLNKVDAINFATTECSNGKCFEEGSLTILCVTANKGNPHSKANRNDAQNTCDIKANKLNGNKSKLSKIQASDVANLVSSANGLGKSEDAVFSCDRSNCLTKGTLHISCKYPDTPAAERETVCEVKSGPTPKEVD